MTIIKRIIKECQEYETAHVRKPDALIITMEQFKLLMSSNVYTGFNPAYTFMNPVKGEEGKIGVIFGMNVYVSTDSCVCGKKDFTDEHKMRCLPYQINGIKDAIVLEEREDEFTGE